MRGRTISGLAAAFPPLLSSMRSSSHYDATVEATDALRYHQVLNAAGTPRGDLSSMRGGWSRAGFKPRDLSAQPLKREA